MESQDIDDLFMEVLLADEQPNPLRILYIRLLIFKVFCYQTSHGIFNLLFPFLNVELCPSILEKDIKGMPLYVIEIWKKITSKFGKNFIISACAALRVFFRRLYRS